MAVATLDPLDELSTVFSALADPTRRAILERLAEGEATVNELAAPFPVSLQAVSKHLKVLERAGLVTRGRDAQHRPARLAGRPLEGASDWLERYRRVLGREPRSPRRSPPPDPRKRPHDRTRPRSTAMSATSASDNAERGYTITRVFDAPRAARVERDHRAPSSSRSGSGRSTRPSTSTRWTCAPAVRGAPPCTSAAWRCRGRVGGRKSSSPSESCSRSPTRRRSARSST